ncbi:ribosome small subunit-dependent GTPase A [Clostridium sediminicola]|uniref:ribosome small subunit-dependent GTPase A n=1 Tax=Clostridium sediminicola TaxID=3114879 RepID=UPI0031F21F8F
MEGIIIKGIAGFYYVKVDDKIIECKARGKFRNNGESPVVGDRVEISIMKNDKGSVEKILKRKNILKRPLVSNITQAFVVFAVKHPDINLDLLNRFLIQCEMNEIHVIVCFNKVDLDNMYLNNVAIKMVKDAGYKTILLHAKEGVGIDEIKENLNGNISVFCGPSGVGKSTILNKIVGSEVMETGKISDRLRRGKHTTRHSELVPIEGGLLVDTPGFSTLDIQFQDKGEIQEYFPEFWDYRSGCKFSRCMHYKEPKCSIKNALEEGKINELRYNFYVKLLEEYEKGGNKRW